MTETQCRQCGAITYPLNAKANNGSALGDWLGTCAVAAETAAHMLSAIRSGDCPDPIAATAAAQSKLEQALSEIKEIRRTAAYSMIAHAAVNDDDDFDASDIEADPMQAQRRGQ